VPYTVFVFYAEGEPVSISIAVRAHVGAVFLFLLLCVLLPQANAVPLNDTGQSLCYDAANAAVACSAAVTGDAGVNPGQDGRYGRDAAAASGALTKTGAGAAGFDYTKIANDGTALGAAAALGTAATSWACTQDNVTGLVWEVKTATAGLRRNTHEYTWYSTAAVNGGNPGVVGTNTCVSTLSAFSNQCNTQNYVAAVNAAGLCGASDWRLPTQRELLSIVNSGAAIPAVDSTYFPNMRGVSTDVYWSSSTRADTPDTAWTVLFERGRSLSVPKLANLTTLTYSAILVRGGL
jgi:hypothetical protein